MQNGLLGKQTVSQDVTPGMGTPGVWGVIRESCRRPGPLNYWPRGAGGLSIQSRFSRPGLQATVDRLASQYGRLTSGPGPHFVKVRVFRCPYISVSLLLSATGSACFWRDLEQSWDANREAPLSDAEPIKFRPRPAGDRNKGVSRLGAPDTSARDTGARDLGLRTVFDRRELNIIMTVYGRKVSQGIWRDYAIDMLRDRAVFSIFRHSCEVPLYRVEKDLKLARKQGAYSVIAAGGLVMKRGHDLERVLSVLDSRIEVVTG